MHNYLPFSMNLACEMSNAFTEGTNCSLRHKIYPISGDDSAMTYLASFRFFGVKWVTIHVDLWECVGCFIPVVELRFTWWNIPCYGSDRQITLLSFKKNNYTMRNNNVKSWRLSFIVTFVQWKWISHSLY